MNSEVDLDNPDCVLRFDGKCTLPDSGTTLTRISDIMKSGQNIIEIDCSQATEVDVSFIQILLAAHRMATARHKTVRLSVPAAGVLLDALERGGFIGSGQQPGDEAWWTGGSAVP